MHSEAMRGSLEDEVGDTAQWQNGPSGWGESDFSAEDQPKISDRLVITKAVSIYRGFTKAVRLAAGLRK